MESNFPKRTKDLKLGDRVIVVLKKGNHLDRGHVRFMGPLAGVPDKFYYGIELDKPNGQHEGKSYFKTKENHGTFMELKNLRKIHAEEFDEKSFNDLLKKEQATKAQEMKKEATESRPKDTPAPVSPTTPKIEQPPAPDEPKKAAPEPKIDTPELQKPAEPSPKKESPPVKAPAEPEKPSPQPTKVIQQPQSDDRKIKEVEANYSELLSKRDKDITSLKGRIRTLEEQLLREKEKASKPTLSDKLEKEFQIMEEKFSNMSIEYESLKSDLENTRYQLDESKLRIQELEFDKEEMLLQAEIAAEDTEEMSEADISEMKKNFGFLKMAYSKLEEKLHSDQNRYENKISDLEGKVKNSDGLNNDQVKKMLKDKERTITELKQRLEDSSGSNEYISDLTEQLINIKNSLEIAEDNVRDAKHTIRLNDEIIEELEDMNGLLNSELDNANNEISALNENFLILQDEKKHDEGVIAKYREKIKLIQGEIDIIKSQNSQSQDKDKINKIDQLIKNYTLCLQEKRTVVKKLIVSEFKDIKDARHNMKSTIVMRSIPPRYVHDLEYTSIDKYLTLLDIIKKIDLISNQLKSNYLANPLVVEDGTELIGHISNCLSILLEGRRTMEYIFDYGFTFEKLEDLKNMIRSPIFGVLVSIEVLLDRLVTEIREDNFNTKFNLKLLADNNGKLLEMISELTDGLKQVRMKESIDIRYYSKIIELQYLVACDYAENKNAQTEAMRNNLAKLSTVSRAIDTEESWIRQHEDIIRKRPHVLGGADESTMDMSKQSISTIEAGDSEAKIFSVAKVRPLFDSIQKVVARIVDGEDVIGLLESLETDVNSYILSNSKKARKVDGEEDYPFHLFTEAGPWMEVVNHVRKRLERFDEVQKESKEKSEKIEDITKKLGEAEIKIENSQKVKATLENRIKDLEFKNQNIPLIEGERVKAVEQAKILTHDVDKLKKEIGILEDKIKLGGSALGHAGGIFSALGKKQAQDEKRGLPGINFKAMEGNSSKTSGMRTTARESDMKSEPISFKSMISYERIIENLHTQLVSKDEDDIFDSKKMMKEMPYFYRLYNKEKKKSIYGNTIEKEGKDVMGRLTLISNQVKNKVISKKVIDITKSKEKDPLIRLKAFAEQLRKEERDIEADKETAVSILDSFQSKWITTYANTNSGNLVHSKLLSDNSSDISNERVIGLVRVEKLNEERLKQLEDTVNRVVLNKSDIGIKKAISLI